MFYFIPILNSIILFHFISKNQFWTTAFHSRNKILEALYFQFR